MFVWHTLENAVLAETHVSMPKQSVSKQSFYIFYLLNRSFQKMWTSPNPQYLWLWYYLEIESLQM